MNENTNTTNNQQPTNSTPEASGGQGTRMFTQDELNRIVSDRLAREREKLAQQPKEDERETALREREKAVEARENRIKCEDHLKGLGVAASSHADLMDALGTDSFDDFKARMKKLEKYFVPKVVTIGAQTAHPPYIGPSSSDAALRDAFKPKI